MDLAFIQLPQDGAWTTRDNLVTNLHTARGGGPHKSTACTAVRTICPTQVVNSSASSSLVIIRSCSIDTVKPVLFPGFSGVESGLGEEHAQRALNVICVR